MRPPTWTSTGSGTPVPRPNSGGSSRLLDLGTVREARGIAHHRLPNEAAQSLPGLMCGRATGRARRFGLTQGQEVGFVEGFLLQEQAGAAFEHLPLRPQQIDRAPERRLNDRFDRAVDLARSSLAVAAFGVGHLWLLHSAEKAVLG